MSCSAVFCFEEGVSFLWRFRGFKRDVLKAGLGVFCSPPSSSLTGTRNRGPQGRTGLRWSWGGETTAAEWDTDVLSDVTAFFLQTELVGAIRLFLFLFPSSSSSLSVCVCSFRWTWVSGVVYYCWSSRYTHTHAACVCVWIVIMISIQPGPHTEPRTHVQTLFPNEGGVCVCVFKPASLVDWENRNISVHTHTFLRLYTHSSINTHTQVTSSNIQTYSLKIPC